MEMEKILVGWFTEEYKYINNLHITLQFEQQLGSQ